MDLFYKSAKETRKMETSDVERGKPHERATQNLVGAFAF